MVDTTASIPRPCSTALAGAMSKAARLSVDASVPITSGTFREAGPPSGPGWSSMSKTYIQSTGLASWSSSKRHVPSGCSRSSGAPRNGCQESQTGFGSARMHPAEVSRRVT